MESIIVGSVAIISHDNYWKYKQQISQLQDYISRGFDICNADNEINPFLLSTKDYNNHNISEYLSEVKEAIKIFEEKYPKKDEVEFIYKNEKQIIIDSINKSIEIFNSVIKNDEYSKSIYIFQKKKEIIDIIKNNNLEKYYTFSEKPNSSNEIKFICL